MQQVDSAPGDFALAVDQTPLSLAISGSVDVPVTIVRGPGFTDTVALAASGLPTGVTATFVPPSLPDGMSAAVMTLKIDTTADPGTSTITVTATGGPNTHTGTTSLELHTQTVTGKVRGNLANVTVRLVGQSAVQSDSSGNFSFTGVKVPYDLYLVGQSGPSNAPIPTVYYWKGLTRTDPTLSAPSTYCSGINCFVFLENTATINGTRSGAGTTTDPIYATWSAGGSGVRSDNTWNFTALFFGSSTTGTLQVLQPSVGTNGAPTGFNYATSSSQTVSSGGTATINLSLAAVPATADLSGTLTAPSGFPTPSIVLSTELQGISVQIWQATTTNAASKIPVIGTNKSSFYATSTTGGRIIEAVYPALTATTDVSMTLPPPAGMTAPAAGATNVTYATPFDFTTTAGSVYEVDFNNSTATFVVYTTDSEIHIPNVPEVMLPTGGKSYQWMVTGYGPFTSVNAAADTNPLIGVNWQEDTGTYHFRTQNPAQTFSTQ